MIGLLAVAAMLGGSVQGVPLTDEALLAYAAKPFDQAEKMHTRDVIGVHNGATVVADFPCSDLCPDYTTRVIHYELAPGQTCEKIGGVVDRVWVPDGIGMERRPYCVPRVLAAGQRGLKGVWEDREKATKPKG